MNTSGGFVKAYSNNWLSQFGIYKYEIPEELPKKPPSNQHRRIALYGILGMAFVLFFILFVVINKSEADRRNGLIVASFSNETSIESSMGHTVLTTPFSSNGTLIVGGENATGISEDANNAIAEARKQRRTRRLGLDNSAAEFNDNLVLYPSEYMKPPRLGSMRRFSEDYSLADSYQLDKSDLPRPFGFEVSTVNPVGFSRQNFTQFPEQTTKSLTNYGMVNNIQDVLNQLSSTRVQSYKFIPHHLQQPSEFNNPNFRNHRVKFSGIYRHPRKNGDITTLFGSSSKQHELRVSKPLDINSQLSVPSGYMPDSLYNFRPANPSDINLLAVDQFRFAPEKSYDAEEPLPKGMPFSIMLDVLPMADGSVRFKRPLKKRPPQNYANTNFPSYFNNQNFAQVQNAVYNQQYPEEDSYFRSSSSYYRPQQQRFIPTMKPGKLMVHLNLYPKKPAEASRKFELEKTALDINHLQLNVGETLPDPEAHLVDPTTTTAIPNFLEMFYGVKSLPPVVTSTPSSATTKKSTVLSPVPASGDQEPSESFTNGHAAMGRYPPYRMVKKRHEVVDPRSLEELQQPKSTKLNLVSFDEKDAV
ncbi:uncharacterized protein LOC110676010 [Aedes aegypti]|uniref:Uncharacterized protein n=1 Tax=Aedes aegypti TaxID=7159 RepID=A0A6I8U1Z5_AEDAE|nr:uncharacterized protein LOC110676010 [Aedes aegypti]